MRYARRPWIFGSHWYNRLSDFNHRANSRPLNRNIWCRVICTELLIATLLILMLNFTHHETTWWAVLLHLILWLLIFRLWIVLELHQLVDERFLLSALAWLRWLVLLLILALLLSLLGLSLTKWGVGGCIISGGAYTGTSIWIKTLLLLIIWMLLLHLIAPILQSLLELGLLAKQLLKLLSSHMDHSLLLRWLGVPCLLILKLRWLHNAVCD